MTKTFKLNENLFFIDGHYYGVDKDAEVKDGDYYWDKISDRWSKLTPSTIIAFERIWKIIFSNNPSLELLLIIFPDKEDEIEKLANKCKAQRQLVGEDKRLTVNGFIEGYKANPAKFTEQDIRDAIKEGIEIQKRWTTDESFREQQITIYLQSKEKLIESFKVEMININQHNSLPDGIGVVHSWRPKLNSLGQVEALNIKYKN